MSIQSVAIDIKRLQEPEMPAAEQLISIAFSKHLGIADPSNFNAGASHAGRQLTYPDTAFGAYQKDRLVGVILASIWGSFGYFGPLVVHPDVWGEGIAQRLLEPIIEEFDRNNLTASGLYTFANSVKHIYLYQKFGYWPQYLTGTFVKQLSGNAQGESPLCYSSLSEEDRIDCLDQADLLTQCIHDGLSLRREIEALDRLNLGETVLLYQAKQSANEPGKELIGFAICHCRPGSEAPSESCNIKFGAIKPNADARNNFSELLHLCEKLAWRSKRSNLSFSINTARQEAYKTALDLGFRSKMMGVSMLRPHLSAYNRTDVLVTEDWR